MLAFIMVLIKIINYKHFQSIRVGETASNTCSQQIIVFIFIRGLWSQKTRTTTIRKPNLIPPDNDNVKASGLVFIKENVFTFQEQGFSVHTSLFPSFLSHILIWTQNKFVQKLHKAVFDSCLT